MNKQKQESNLLLWGMIIIIFTLPYSLVLIPIGIFFYFIVIRDMKHKEEFFDRFFGKIQERIGKNSKNSTSYAHEKNQIDTDIISQEIFDAFIIYDGKTDAPSFQEKLNDIYASNGIQDNTYIQSQVFQKALKKLQAYKHTQGVMHKKSDSLSTKNKSSYNSQKNTTFPSIWDDYESVIDIMKNSR